MKTPAHHFGASRIVFEARQICSMAVNSMEVRLVDEDCPGGYAWESATLTE